MAGEFYDSDFSIKIDPCDFKLPVVESIPIFWIEPVVAGELLFNFRMPIGLKGKRVRCNLYGPGFANEGAGEFTDDKGRCTGRSFFVLCILNSQYIARILYQSMLKASSRRDERPAHFASETNRLNRSIHIFVRTTRSTPEGIKLFERCPRRLTRK